MTLKASFIGLGNMGSPMAFNLLKQGVDLGVYNRSKEKADPLVEGEPSFWLIQVRHLNMILSVIEMLGEAFAVAQKSGINPEQLHAFLTETLFPSPVFLNYGKILYMSLLRIQGVFIRKI